MQNQSLVEFGNLTFDLGRSLNAYAVSQTPEVPESSIVAILDVRDPAVSRPPVSSLQDAQFRKAVPSALGW